MIITPSEIDYANIDRFFSFGCSFTFYKWPTWSHIMSEEMPEIPYFNFGDSGAGNLMISNRITEADCRYKFSQNDLVVVMWSTLCREDRWLKDRGWVRPGNIYTQNEYSMKFVSKYCHPLGYLIRDISIMALAFEYMKNSSSKFIPLFSVPLDYQQDEDDPQVHEIIELYMGKTGNFLPSLYKAELNGEWPCGHWYHSDHHKGVFGDYHPNPLRYLGYLEKVGFATSDRSREYAHRSTELLHKTKTEKEILDLKFNDRVKRSKMI